MEAVYRKVAASHTCPSSSSSAAYGYSKDGRNAPTAEATQRDLVLSSQQLHSATCRSATYTHL